MNKNLSVIITSIVIVVIISGGIYFATHKKEKNTSASNFSNQKTHQKETEGKQAEDKLSQIKKVYQGFKNAERGDWVIWKMKEGSEAQTVKYVYAGQETINGENCYGWEFSGKFQGMEVAFQTWFSKKDNKPVKYVAKASQGVFCLSPTTYKSQSEVSPQTETPHKYEPENIVKLNFETGTFTTETGKTVNIIKVINPDGSQGWVSSKVPFGIVKIISPSKEVLVELKDFGSGTPLEITKNERDNCQQFPAELFKFSN